MRLGGVTCGRPGAAAGGIATGDGVIGAKARGAIRRHGEAGASKMRAASGRGPDPRFTNRLALKAGRLCGCRHVQAKSSIASPDHQVP
jgi:hypothetical protein